MFDALGDRTYRPRLRGYSDASGVEIQRDRSRPPANAATSRPSLRMVADLPLLSIQAPALLRDAARFYDAGRVPGMHGYGEAFAVNTSLPMASALWSSPPSGAGTAVPHLRYLIAVRWPTTRCCRSADPADLARSKVARPRTSVLC
jgi:hypothetical protein